MKNQYVAAALAWFLGVFGIHNFYLGERRAGVVKIILTITLIGMLYTGIAAIIDTVIHLTMSKEDFDRKYNSGIPRT